MRHSKEWVQPGINRDTNSEDQLLPHTVPGPALSTPPALARFNLKQTYVIRFDVTSLPLCYRGGNFWREKRNVPLKPRVQECVSLEICPDGA